MAAKSQVLQKITGNMVLVGGFAAETLTGTRTLTLADAQCQALDPGGAGRTVVLPDVEQVAYDGLFFVVANTANAAESLTITDADSNTVATAGRDEAAIVYVSTAGAWTLFRLLSTST